MATREIVTVARAEEVPPGTTKVVTAGGRELALANVDGRFYATQNECAHLKGRSATGCSTASLITCPWHGRQYDVRTGENEFDRAITVETFDVTVEDGDVKVAV